MYAEHDFLKIHDREIHVKVWNRGSPKTIVCWHGLARTNGDFNQLAETLAKCGYQVLAPTTIGRGLSQWAVDPTNEYQLSNYSQHAVELLEHYKVNKLIWVGTSMGGLLGMLLAGSTLSERIEKLILNDIGPEVPKDALVRINDYVSDLPEYNTQLEFETRIKVLYSPFGKRSHQQWHEMSIETSRRKSNGKFVSHYDPAISGQFDPSVPIPTLWPLFKSITAPILVIHGNESDVLTSKILQQMKVEKPRLEYLNLADCGHAPGLHLKEHIDPIVSFVSKE